MAHSNRQKLRDARGGLTRNQQRKSQKMNQSSGQSNRLQDTINWLAANEEKKRAKTVTNTEVKVIKFSKHKKVIARRKRVIERLEHQLATDGQPLKYYKENNSPSYAKSVERIKEEIRVLRNRT